ncbi:MAG: hypothetical protein HKN12_10870, partial [Gemmatimonadetes bacterium]|nr:hypothetical protein [Gemmatimonadota bacterium]
MRVATWLAAAAVTAGLGAPGAGAEEIKGDFHETFDVSPGTVLKLHHGDGDVFFQVWDQDVIDVKVRYRASFAMVGVGSKPAFGVEFTQEGNEVRVTGREKGVAMVGIFLATSVSEYVYEIKVPEYIALESIGQDGDLNLAGLRGGPVRSRVDDGDIVLTDIQASRIDLELDDGDFRGERLNGPLSVRSQDGNV